jgi:hypothetical protein
MPTFSEVSSDRLYSCATPLITLFETVVLTYDCSIISGFRTEEEQNALFYNDPPRTQLVWPFSRHNSIPSRAVDVMPYPVDWSDIAGVCHFAGYVQRVAEELNINVEWGGSWQRFKDYPHWELTT